MQNYKVIKTINNEINTVHRLIDNTFIPFDPTNTDYQRFKKEINEETARLQNAEGELYTKEQAKVVVSSLP